MFHGAEKPLKIDFSSGKFQDLIKDLLVAKKAELEKSEFAKKQPMEEVKMEEA